MLYQDFINRIRVEIKDKPEPVHNDFTGDGTTTRFVVTDVAIIEDSYIVKVGGTQKTEGIGNDYTIDLDSGVITFNVAPTNAAAITIDYQKAIIRNGIMIDIVNSILEDMEGEYWLEVDDTSFGNSDDSSISIACPTDCIDVINFFYKTIDSTSVNWSQVIEIINWSYSKSLNAVKLGKPFTSIYPLRLNYLRGFTKGNDITDTLDIPPSFEMVLQLGCLWRAHDHLIGTRREVDSKLIKEQTLTPLQLVQNLSSHYYKLYLKEKGRKKPTKPAKILMANNHFGGTP